MTLLFNLSTWTIAILCAIASEVDVTQLNMTITTPEKQLIPTQVPYVRTASLLFFFKNDRLIVV